jgi:hypothetical protein
MKIILFIEDEQLMKKILKHLDLWDVKRKPPPCANGPIVDMVNNQRVHEIILGFHKADKPIAGICHNSFLPPCYTGYSMKKPGP